MSGHNKKSPPLSQRGRVRVGALTSANRWRASSSVQARAKGLRRRMTPAEVKLWRHLRNRQLGGAFFRKQHAVGPFVVDFFCARSRLAVEIDGDTHPQQVRYDAVRTRWLSEQKGFRVLRFANRDVLGNIEGVLYAIDAARGGPLSNSPPLRQGRGLRSP